jgi:hypothetical protein
MFNRLSKTLFRHSSSTGWNIPGYGSQGLLLFTNPTAAKEYNRAETKTGAGDSVDVDEGSFGKLDLADLEVVLQQQYSGTGKDELPLTVIFNLSSKGHYDAVYSVPELLQLLQGEKSFCSALDSHYEASCFEGIYKLYNYQGELTPMLDARLDEFNQEVINEIVLWKVDRYVSTQGSDWLSQLNEFKHDTEVHKEKLTKFLNLVLSNKVGGVRLAMASTFLRFRNPNVYQIIDERMFRVVMRNRKGKKNLTDVRTIQDQINLYITYLDTLREVCNSKKIVFRHSDRILYQFDILKNGDFKSPSSKVRSTQQLSTMLEDKNLERQST